MKFKSKKYFEGWFFKQSNATNCITFIPSYHIDEAGTFRAFLQIIKDNEYYCVEYNKDEFSINHKDFIINIGNNRFSKQGIELNISNNYINISGKISFGNFCPPRYNVMGPFAMCAFIECAHSVFSLKHSVNGYIVINNVRYDFQSGTGYIEGDRGRSFPQKYLWTECNINDNEETVVMISIATVKLFNIKFKGSICLVLIKDKEYRIATYLGAKILDFSKYRAEIKQRNYLLVAEQLSESPLDLKAPVDGVMKRIIKESPTCKVRYRFYIKGKLVLDRTCDNASFEFSIFDNNSL